MWTPACNLAIAASLALLGVAHADFSGDMTAYTLSSPSSGNCNFMATPSAASQNYAALNGAQWESTKNCGRCAEVSCTDARCTDKSKTEIVHIVDQCPECKSGDLDVSPSVFKSLTGSDPSRYTIKWRFVDCPVTGNLKYCLKGGSNPFFTAIQPANAAAGVKSMTINSAATSMVPSAYYYLLEGANLDLSSVKVSVTSLSGQVITETVSLRAGSCTTGTAQFTSGGNAPVSPAVTPAPAPATKKPTPATTTKTPSATPSATTPPSPATTSSPSPTSATPAYTTTPAVVTSTPAASTTAPSPAPKTKKPTTTKKPSKDAADSVGGEATATPSPSPSQTKKPVSCRRRED